MKDIRIGTSGYDYLDWKGPFYAEEEKRSNFLSFYSSRFDTVELNFSYYRMPTEKQLSSILERSDPTMDISIKAHESMTHKVDCLTWKESVKTYCESITPLLKADKLAAVLLQFPYSFHYTPEKRQYLDQLIKEMPEIPLVVEFRNSEWLNKRVFDALRERKVGFCSVDAPPLRGLPAPVDIATSNIAYIRFHGRNEKTWWGSDAAARFDYRYKEEELHPWINRIITMLKSAEKIRIYFNNHRRGQATDGALLFKNLLKKENLL